MKALISIIEYCPLPERDESFGIGLIMLNPDSGLVKIQVSEKRIQRIQRAFGLKKSALLHALLKNLQDSQTVLAETSLYTLSKYENGLLRFSSPKPVAVVDQNATFEQLYTLLVADIAEQAKKTPNKNTRYLLHESMRKDSVIQRHLNINYTVSKEALHELIATDTKVDFIGGNGTVYCGMLPDLNYSESVNKIILFFQALSYNLGSKFIPSNCNIIVLKKDWDSSEYIDQAHFLSQRVKKEDYTLKIVNNIEDTVMDIRKDVERKNIMPFREWIWDN